MSIELSDKLNTAFGDRGAFHVLVDSHWPEIDLALCAFDRLKRERDAFKEESRQRMTIAVEQKRRGDRLEEALSECRDMLGAARHFVVSGPALHSVKVERGGGMVTREELGHLISTALTGSEGHHAAGKRAVQALAGLTFGTNPDRLELEDLPASDPLCVRCADQEPASPPLANECTCGEVVVELRNARMLVNHGNGDVRDEPDPLHEKAADIIERIGRELAVEREMVAHLTQAVEQSPRPGTIRAMSDALARCEMWFSTHPEGSEMRDVCRAARQ